MQTSGRSSCRYCRISPRIGLKRDFASLPRVEQKHNGAALDKYIGSAFIAIDGDGATPRRSRSLRSQRMLARRAPTCDRLAKNMSGRSRSNRRLIVTLRTDDLRRPYIDMSTRSSGSIAARTSRSRIQAGFTSGIRAARICTPPAKSSCA